MECIKYNWHVHTISYPYYYLYTETLHLFLNKVQKHCHASTWCDTQV